MQSDVKIAGWLTAYAFTLLGLSAAFYLNVSGPAPPTLSVEAEPEQGFGPDGKVTLRFRTDRRLGTSLKVGYSLAAHEAAEGVDYQRQPAAEVTIPIGGEDAKLVLERLEPQLPEDAGPRREARDVITVSLEGGPNVQLDPARSRVELPIELVRSGPPLPPYEVTLSFQKEGDPSTGPVQAVFSDQRPVITVFFRLDRPAEQPLEIGYSLDGTATGNDYTVETGPRDAPGVVTIPAGGIVAALNLNRRPITETARGKGDRDLRVALKPAPRMAAGAVSGVTVVVPDPKARLSWSVEPNLRTFDARSASTARLNVALNTERTEPVTVRYRVQADADLSGDGLTPAVQSIRLEPRAMSQGHEFSFAKTDLVSGPARTLRIELDRVEPEDLNNQDALPPQAIVVADDRPLPGKALVLLVLTDDLKKAQGGETLQELKKFAATAGAGALTGDSLYLLTADDDGSIYRLNPDATALQDRRAFAPDVYYEEVLKAAAKGVTQRFISPGRLPGTPLIVLVWQDFAVKARTTGGTPFDEREGKITAVWRLFWIGPAPNGSNVPSLLERWFTEVQGRKRFLPLEKPQGLAAQLRFLLRGDSSPQP